MALTSNINIPNISNTQNTNISSIDQAKLKNESDKKSKNDWKGFGLDMIKNVIYVILWAIIGANFIFISRSNLDAWFPTNPNAAPYFDPSKQTGLSGMFDKSSQQSSNVKLDKEEIEMLYNTLGMNKVNFPYNKITDKTGIMEIIGNYFGQSARFSYTSDRNIIKSFLSFFSGGQNKKEIALFLIAFPLFVMSLVFFLPFFIGAFTTFIGQLTTGKLGILYFFITLFFGIPFFWSFILGLLQYLQYLVTFTLLPPIINFDKVLKIIGSRAGLLLGLFTFLIIYSAFKRLDTVIAIVMLCSALFMAIGKKTHEIVTTK